MDGIAWFEYDEDDLDIGDPQRNQGVLTVGVHFDGCVVRGGELHNQDFTYEYADTGRGLCEGFEEPLAPPALRERLAADGVIRGKGLINRARLGQPDVIPHVRGIRLDQ